MPNTAASDAASPVIIAVASAPERRVIERSNLETHRITLLQTGVGPVQIRSMANFIGKQAPAGLISVGTAGGLAPGLPPGHLLLPLQICAEDEQIFSVTSHWHTLVSRQLTDGEIETGRLVSVSQPAHSSQDKQKLHARTGAVAVDMESAELARIAAHHAIPFLVIRAVADPHDQMLPRSAVAALTARGELRIAGLLGQLLRHPAEFAALLRLNGNFRAASRTLSGCFRAAGEQICSPDQ